MKITTTLEDVQWAAGLCLKCGGCTYGSWPENHHLCSLFYRDPCFTFGGGGFMSLAKSLANKRLNYDKSIAELAFTCTGCAACDSRCKIIRSHRPHVDPSDIVRLIRYESVQRGLIPEGIAVHIDDEVKQAGDLGSKTSLELSAEIKSDQADIVIFAECSHNETQKSISAAVASLLAKVGSPVALFAEKGCCGSTLYDYGFWEQLKPLIEANWEQMKQIKDKKFVFTNPHCQEFIIKRYPENIPDYSSIDNQHISQLLADAFKNGILKSKKTDKIKVSYHDPCYLGRGLGIYDAPREVLSSLEGVKLVEMTRNRVDSYCCGAKALGNYFPEISKETARERIEEFKATGADLLITACPYCKENLQKVMPDGEKDSVMDLTEFVNERV